MIYYDINRQSIDAPLDINRYNDIYISLYMNYLYICLVLILLILADNSESPARHLMGQQQGKIAGDVNLHLSSEQLIIFNNQIHDQGELSSNKDHKNEDFNDLGQIEKIVEQNPDQHKESRQQKSSKHIHNEQKQKKKEHNHQHQHHDHQDNHKHDHHNHDHHHHHDHHDHHHDHKHSEQNKPKSQKQEAHAQRQLSAKEKQLNSKLYEQRLKQNEKIREEYIKRMNSVTPLEKVYSFFTTCSKEIEEWISFPLQKQISQILNKCQIQQNAEKLLQFYQSISKLSTDFIKQHLDFILQEFKDNEIVPKTLKCIVDQRSMQNKFFDQKKKYKVIGQFIKKYPSQGKDAFPLHQNFTLIGQKTCHFFKAFFQFYYLEILDPSGTLSTQFFRALTVRSNIFQHEDISYCISLETVGKLTGELQDLDINNIYVKIPEIFKLLRFIKLKDKCKDDHNMKLIKNLQKALEGLDMFKIMYQQYQPFVEISAQKLVQTQIRMLARKFSEIIRQKQRYLSYSKEDIFDQL